MGRNLRGTDARIWGLHCQEFSVSQISGLVGLAEERVRNVITGVWYDDKLESRGKAA